MYTPKKVIIDPVHGPIRFNVNLPEDRLAWKIIHSPEFRRLNYITQQDFRFLELPSATHTRYAHSIGTYHIARKLLKIIKDSLPQAPYTHRAKTAAIAALVHDVGHGPLSHAFEDILQAIGIEKRHEQWTREILSDQTALGQIIIEEQGIDFLEEVNSFFMDDVPEDIFTSIISSQFDADRLDYIKRDIYMSGLQSGSFDLNWILEALEIGTINIENDKGKVAIDCFILNSKAKDIACEYLYARYLNQINAYNKTKQAYVLMFKDLYALIEKDAKSLLLLKHPLFMPIYQLLHQHRIELKDYLSLTDYKLWATVDTLKHSPNPKVSQLAQRIMRHDPYISINLSDLAYDQQKTTMILDNLTAESIQYVHSLKIINSPLVPEKKHFFDSILVYTDREKSQVKKLYDIVYQGALPAPPITLNRIFIKKTEQLERAREIIKNS